LIKFERCGTISKPLDFCGYWDHDADSGIFIKEFFIVARYGRSLLARILLITREIVDGLLWDFFERRDVSLARNRYILVLILITIRFQEF